MFEKFNLRDEAFPVTPIAQQKTPWFGFKTLRQEFDSVFQRSATEGLRLCVLTRGRFGAGKTHAARYFSEKYTSKRNLGNYLHFIPIIIETPKQPQKAFADFANRLFNTITFQRILQASQNLRSLHGDGVLFSKLLDATSSEDVATVLSKIDESNLLTSKVFLLGGGTVKDLRGLSVAKRLTSEHDFALAIIGTLYLLIHGQLSERESISRVMLWVDEMEDLVYFPTRYYLPFTQAMRDVIDNINLHMTLMLNFTFSEPENLPSIENVLGRAIMERVNQHIVFQQPSVDDLRDYLLELFKFNRVDARKCSSTFPFSQDAFELLIGSAASRTPRFLNKLCDMLLRELEHDPGFDIGKRREIAPEIVEERLPRILNVLEEARG